MEGKSLGLEGRIEIAPTVPEFTNLFARPKVETRINQRVGLFDPSFDGIYIVEPRAVCETVGNRPAVDVVLPNPFVDQINRGIGQPVKFAGTIRADAAEQGFKAAGEAVAYKAAVAALSAPSNPT